MAPPATAASAVVASETNDEASTIATTGDFDTVSRAEPSASTPVATTHFRAWLHEPGVLHDAHWRNGVPSRIQHAAESQGSNFSVMQIGLPNNHGDAARLTSEMTVAAAKSFDNSNYWSTIRKSRKMFLNGVTSAKPASLDAAASSTSITAPRHSSAKRTAPLSPREIKFEQARLLTLLRSLNPVVVVEQLCKAAAYFGGIPMAPPPGASEAFPQSELGNGPGSNFVGWLAEIFPSMAGTNLTPPLPNESTVIDDTSQSQAGATDGVLPESSGAAEVPAVAPKKKRGRPKGSKSSKVRSDKGKKHVARRHRDDAQNSIAAGDGENAEDEANHVEPENSAQSSIRQTLSVPEESSNQPKDTNVTPQSRKRGRPKGSKTRNKNRKAGSGADSTGTGTDPIVTVHEHATTDLANTTPSILNDQHGLPQQLAVNHPIQEFTEILPPQSSRKRKQQLDTAGSEDNMQAAFSPQIPNTGKRHRASDSNGGQPATASQPASVSNSSDPQDHVGPFRNGNVRTYSATQLPQYYMAASNRQIRPNISPIFDQTRPQSATHAFSSNNVHMAGQNYYRQQQGMQQASQQLTPMSMSNSGFDQRRISSNTARPSQYQSKQPSEASSASTQGGSKSGYQTIQQRQPPLPASNTSNMSSYSSFGSQGFM